MFDLTMFPAADGDCLLLSYGPVHGKTRHVLVDGGRSDCFTVLKDRLDEISLDGETIELLVLTHIDGDHIAGLLKLIQDKARWALVKEVWFNGLEQLSELEGDDRETLSWDQADRYSQALSKTSTSVNGRFGGSAIMTDEDGAPRCLKLDGGLELTILSPTPDHLRRFRSAWVKKRSDEAIEENETEPEDDDTECLSGQLRPDVEELAGGEEKSDTGVVNGSSIAFLATWDGATALMGADAFPDVLAAGLGRLGRQAVEIDLYKVAHHGGSGNTSHALLDAMRCSRFAISTNGAHEHPARDSIAKIVLRGAASAPEGQSCQLFFNYRQEFSELWNDEVLMRRFGYTALFPPSGKSTCHRVPVKRLNSE